MTYTLRFILRIVGRFDLHNISHICGENIYIAMKNENLHSLGDGLSGNIYFWACVAADSAVHIVEYITSHIAVRRDVPYDV